MLVCLHRTNDCRNLPDDLLQLGPIDPRVSTALEMQEDHEAELHCLYPEQVKVERWLNEQYKVGVTEVIDLCSSNSDGDNGN